MIRLYVPSPRPILPVRNTDWVYPRMLCNVSQYCNQLAITFPRSSVFDVWTHARFGLDYIHRRAHIPIPDLWTYKLSQFFTLPNDREEERSDAIYAYERFPTNAKKPVIWSTGATDLPKLLARGWSSAAIQREIDFKREASKRAAIVVFPTHWQRREFEQLIRPTKPTTVLRYLITFPPAPWEVVMAKWSERHSHRMLFVGRAARRKGLPLVLATFAALRRSLGKKITLHVVTEESDGPIEFPSVSGITRETRITHSRMIELMHAAHFLVMPSIEESYGLAYIEAMASGAIPVANNMPNQRELLHEGQAGLVVDRTVDDLVNSIQGCIEDPGKAERIVNYGRRLWETEYQPSVVSDTLHRIASLVLSQKG